MRRPGYYFLMAILFAPLSLFAQVQISEIAWMGTEESHFCNWIELYNTSNNPVDIGDWSIQIGDIVREFSQGEAVSTVIPAQSYYVIKRTTNTCPDPIPGVAGLLLAFGNLPNAGTTLRLRRPDGSDADVVVGGENWQLVGGDNTTKDTAQRTSSGWITASPTPGQANATTPSESAEVTGLQSSVSSSQRFVSATSLRTTTELIDTGDMSVQIIGPEIIQVGQMVLFEAKILGVGDGIKNSLTYKWNFGDFHADSGQEKVTHIFNRPGVYLVAVEAVHNTRKAKTYHEITVVPVRVSMTYTEDGDLLLHNDTDYDINLSGYTLSGIVTLEVPDNTYVLARQTVRVPVELHDRYEPTLVILYDKNGNIVASQKTVYTESFVELEATPLSTTENMQQQHSVSSQVPFFTNVALAETNEVERVSTSDTTILNTSQMNGAKENLATEWFDIFMYVVLVMLLFVAAGLLLPKKTT